MTSRYIDVNTNKVQEVLKATQCSHSYKSRLIIGEMVTCDRPIYKETLCKEHHFYQLKRQTK